LASLFADEMQRDAAGVTAQAMLPQINSLPRSKREPAIVNRNTQVHRCERGADVRGHVIAAFRRVDEKRVAVRHKPFEKRFQARRTSGSAFSWINNEAEVCCKCNVSRPARNLFSVTHFSTSRVNS
jgi:hypothetical protein